MISNGEAYITTTPNGHANLVIDSKIETSISSTHQPRVQMGGIIGPERSRSHRDRRQDRKNREKRKIERKEEIENVDKNVSEGDDDITEGPPDGPTDELE